MFRNLSRSRDSLRRHPAAFALWVALAFAPAVFAGPSELPGLRFSADRGLRYLGATEIRQFEDGSEIAALGYDLELLILPLGERSTAAGGDLPLLFARAVKKRGSDDPPNAILERYLARDGDVRPAGDDPVQETVDVAWNVGTFLPLEPLPPLSGLEPGRSRRAEAELVVLNRGVVKGIFQITLERSLEALVVRRKLSGARDRGFDFDGTPAELLSFDESFRLDSERGVIAGWKRALSLLLEIEENSKIRMEVRTELNLAEALDLRGKYREEYGELKRSLEEALGAFARLPPSKELAPLVSSLSKRFGSGVFRAVAQALETRLRAYRALYEEGEYGRILKNLIGKPAPDFVLEDLDGNKVRFRDLIRGKVALLSFWGYG